ncbi:MAG: MFS transporter [Bacteroidales bacterium]|nr:MFS transporter [Bacteroidales bacterium]
MTENNTVAAAPKAPLIQKIGYGFGDMSSSMFWKIFTAYLPFFYSTIFGLSLVDATFLMLITRIWDAISDPMMGVIADRTSTRWGKYRPYLLWIAIPFAVAGILLFTTPDVVYGGKRVWAYVTYILMMTVYTAINVPYGAMLGVMTSDSDEKTVFSSFRMFFAYAGSFIVLAGWEPLCKVFNRMQGIEGNVNDPASWQYAMIVVAICCAVLFCLTFALTRETVKTEKKETSVVADLGSLLKNSPWWILLGGVLFFNFFNAVRYTVGPFFFASIIGDGATLSFFSTEFLFYAGIFFAVGEVANMAGVAMTPMITRMIGKKSTFMACLILLIVLSSAFFFVPCTTAGYWMMMLLQVVISILTGIVSPLVWSMYADIADYAELKFNTVSTGLIFSSSSMAQKFGGAIGGSAVTAILAAVGYSTVAGAVQTESALTWVRAIMSFVPAGVAALSLVFITLYPLTTKRMKEIQSQLEIRRSKA